MGAGAEDPNSGSASLLEVARGLGQLLSSGWKPRRTIMLLSWDAEEYGLVGSTEWVEDNMAMLAQRAVAYLNVDGSTSGQGPFNAEAVPSLAVLIQDVAKTVVQPKAVPSPVEGTVYGQDRASETETVYEMWNRLDPDERPNFGPMVYGLGSGSDYTPFLDHVGVPSTDMGFSGGENEGYYAVYHSAYDSFHWMESFGDPSYEFHAAAAKIWGGVAIHLADACVLPFDYTRTAADLSKYLDVLKAATPSLDWALMVNAVAAFEQAAEKTKADMAATGLTDLQTRMLNDRLIGTQRAFLVPEGLHGRPWYKHAVFSPAENNAYASTKYPSVTDAIASNDLLLAQIQIAVAARAITRAATILRG